MRCKHNAANVSAKQRENVKGKGEEKMYGNTAMYWMRQAMGREGQRLPRSQSAHGLSFGWMKSCLMSPSLSQTPLRGGKGDTSY